MKDKIITRVMYTTDPDYRKGMKVAILESTGEIIKRHFDNVYLHIPKEMKEKCDVVFLSYEQTDWKAAGYEI
jgi:transcriptional accessory protein Tex/SPT6